MVRRITSQFRLRCCNAMLWMLFMRRTIRRPRPRGDQKSPCRRIGGGLASLPALRSFAARVRVLPWLRGASCLVD